MSEYWRGRPVFVTGATGLVGSWLVPALIDRGASVVALVRDNVPRSRLVRDGWLDRIVTVRGELTNDKLLRRILVEYSVDTVFHLGAQTLVNLAKADPVGTLEANVQGTWTVLDASHHAGVKCVLVASSDKAFGAVPQPKAPPFQGQYPYEISKACADLITTMYAATYGLPAAIVRCGNLFGGGDLNFSRLIPGLIQSTLRGDRFHMRSDGKSVRDFLYVEDAVEAYFHVAEQIASDPSLRGESFYFGMESRLTVLELVEKVLYLMGRSDLRPAFQESSAQETREEPPKIKEARIRLTWPLRLGIDRALQRTIDWYTDFFASEALAQSRSARA